MRSIVLTLIVIQLLLPGAFSTDRKPPKTRPVMCKNPKAKEGSSMMQGCSTATCRKVGKKGFWQPCPDPALEETVLENQRLIDRNNKLLEEIMEILGQPSCCPSIQTTTWAPASTTSQGQMVNPVVLLTGGSNPKNSKMTQSAEVYSPSGTCNKDLEDIPYGFVDHSIDFFNGEIIICGGQLSSTRCLLMDQNQTFVEHSQLNQHHSYHGSAVVSGALTIVGGRSSDTVETWSGSQWDTKRFDEIDDQHISSCIGAIGKDTFLMVGGYSGRGYNRTNQMLKYYKADKNQDGVWERMEDCPGPARAGIGCAFIETPEGDSFIIAGGTTRQNNYQDTSFLYNIQKNTWEEVGRLSYVRLGGKIVVVDGKVLMLGGSYAPTVVEEYDVRTKTWSPIGQQIKQTRGQFDAVVVPGALVGC